MTRYHKRLSKNNKRSENRKITYRENHKITKDASILNTYQNENDHNEKHDGRFDLRQALCHTLSLAGTCSFHVTCSWTGNNNNNK